jgi:hypothetical protein
MLAGHSGRRMRPKAVCCKRALRTPPAALLALHLVPWSSRHPTNTLQRATQPHPTHQAGPMPLGAGQRTAQPCASCGPRQLRPVSAPKRLAPCRAGRRGQIASVECSPGRRPGGSGGKAAKRQTGKRGPHATGPAQLRAALPVPYGVGLSVHETFVAALDADNPLTVALVGVLTEVLRVLGVGWVPLGRAGRCTCPPCAPPATSTAPVRFQRVHAVCCARAASAGRSAMRRPPQRRPPTGRLGAATWRGSSSASKPTTAARIL